MESNWDIKEENSIPDLDNPVLIEGLPGIGNVGKIAIDFLIDELEPTKIYSFFSPNFPNSVFVNDDDLVELPKIEVYAKSFEDEETQDLLILTGDVQPTDEESSYAFCDEIIKISKELNVKNFITTGGIGIKDIPDEPEVYITGNDKELIKDYSENTGIKTDVHEVVGPIIGISGLLIGLSKDKGIEGVALLSQTLAHPMYLGVEGAENILTPLNDKFNLDLELDKMEERVEDLEKETIKRTKELKEIKDSMESGGSEETNYIG